MTTAADIIKLSLKDVGVLDESDTPSAALMDDSLTTLNQMLALWQLSNIHVYADREITFVPTGAASYTVGTGGVVNTTAPAKIDYAFHRLSGIDYPIEILNTFNEYNSITYKAVTTIPDVLYYNPTNPLGVLYLYPKPNSGEVHLQVKVALPEYTTSADAISLPKDYELAVRYNLSILLASMLNVPLRPDIERIAQSVLRMIKRNNLQINELSIMNDSLAGSARIIRGY